MGEIKAASKEQEKANREKKVKGNIKVIGTIAIMKGRLRDRVKEVSYATINNTCLTSDILKNRLSLIEMKP